MTTFSTQYFETAEQDLEAFVSGTDAVAVIRRTMLARLKELGITEPKMCRDLIGNASMPLGMVVERYVERDDMTALELAGRIQEMFLAAKEAKQKHLGKRAKAAPNDLEPNDSRPEGAAAQEHTHRQLQDRRRKNSPRRTEPDADFPKGAIEYYHANCRNNQFCETPFFAEDGTKFPSHEIHYAITSDLVLVGCRAAKQELGLTDDSKGPNDSQRGAPKRGHAK